MSKTPSTGRPGVPMAGTASPACQEPQNVTLDMNGSALGFRLLCGCAPLLLGLGSCASIGEGFFSAGDSGPYSDRAFHKEGFYVAGFGEATRIEGDFDDPIAIVDDLTNPTESVAVPELDNGGGYSVRAGYRWHKRSLEIGYGVSEFDGDFLGFDLDADVHTISVDFKEFYRVETNLQPFLFVGLGMPEMKIDNAALDLVTVPPPPPRDAELDGIQINVGGGVNFYVTPQLALTAQGMYTFGRYDEAKTLSGDESILGTIDADALTAAFGVSYTF